MFEGYRWRQRQEAIRLVLIINSIPFTKNIKVSDLIEDDTPAKTPGALEKKPQTAAEGQEMLKKLEEKFKTHGGSKKNNS